VNAEHPRMTVTSHTRSADPLLQPFQLKHLRLRNRIMLTSHEPAYAEDGMPKERYRAYHLERAKGGVALTMTAGSAAVARDSPPVFNNLLLYKDEVVPWLKDLADACHEQGTAVMIQITHLGRRTRWDKGDWLPAVSSSHKPEAAHRAFPKLIEDWDIDRIITCYADAAERVRAAGLDGLELEAHGHLLDQLWSPRTNTLDGAYGGSLENRLRLTFEVLTAVRRRVGNEFLVGIRMTCDERTNDGLTLKDGIEISTRLKDSGLIDFLNVVRGHIDTDAGNTDLTPIQGTPSAPHLDSAGAIRAATQFPTFHAGRIQDVATARYAIQSGKVDMIGLVREHMADPYIVRKIMSGREDEIRPCVGANYCLDRIYQSGEALCIHNPSTGREQTLPHEISRAGRKRKVVVIGAGPAGLEAARVAALRGHEVVVYEATGKPGGQIRLTVQSARRREMMGIIDWRMQQCTAHGVTFKFDALAEKADVLAERPDIVIVATGGYPGINLLQFGNELVVSTWDIISAHVKPASNVLLFDDAGDHAALQAAEIIAASGAKLEIMTPDRTFAPEVMAMNLVPYMRSLQALDVTFTVTFRLEAVARDGDALIAAIGSDYRAVDKPRRIDQVVVNHGTLPLAELYFDLKPLSRNIGAVDYDQLIAGVPQSINANAAGLFELYRVGDAVSARNTHAAIYDSFRLVKDL
jgi:N-methyl-L-proline demethylase